MQRYKQWFLFDDDDYNHHHPPPPLPQSFFLDLLGAPPPPAAPLFPPWLLASARNLSRPKGSSSTASTSRSNCTCKGRSDLSVAVCLSAAVCVSISFRPFLFLSVAHPLLLSLFLTGPSRFDVLSVPENSLSGTKREVFISVSKSSP